jgi:hypothetical protein
MSVKYTNPTALLGFGRGVQTRLLTIAEGDDPTVQYNLDKFDVEVILTEKFVPGWYEDSSIPRMHNQERRFRWFQEEPSVHSAWRRADVNWPEPNKEF